MDSLETELLIQHIRELKAGNIVQVPAYDFTTHTRLPQSKAVTLAAPRPILLIEGILILCHPELVQEMDLKVFVVSLINVSIGAMDKEQDRTSLTQVTISPFLFLGCRC